MGEKEIFARHENSWNEIVLWPDGEEKTRFVKQQTKIKTKSLFEKRTEEICWLAGFLNSKNESRTKDQIKIVLPQGEEQKTILNKVCQILNQELNFADPFVDSNKKTINLIIDSQELCKFLAKMKKLQAKKNQKGYFHGRLDAASLDF